MKNHLSATILARLIAALLFVAVVAGTWDAWWHGAVGRETFWEPPHILLYSAIIGAIAGVVYGWKTYHEAPWRRVAVVLLVILIAAPFDDLWHRLFGVESLNSPLIVWSPPHLALIGSLIASFALLLPILKKDSNEHARRLLGAITFTSVLSLLLFVLVPIQPTGPFALLGFWGAGPAAFAMVAIYLLGQRWIDGFGATFLLALVVLALTAIEFGGTPAPDILITPHGHPPAWLTAFSILLPAVFLDLSIKLPLAVRGTGAALICCGLLYGFSSMFLPTEFQFGIRESITAIIAGTIGGLLAGMLIQKIHK